MNDSFLKNLHRCFDHAALQARVDEAAVRKLCDEALKYHFHSVAINPCWVKYTRMLLEKPETCICSVAGFPLGASRTDIKVKEAIKAASDGAHELDMVANIGWLVSDRFPQVEEETRQVREALPYNIVLKVIIEAGELTEQQQLAATRAAINAGAQFVKTGTGFLGNVTIKQVKTLYRVAQGQIQIKAAGGIRTLDQSLALLQAGAARLGSSRSVQIMEELRARENLDS